MSHPSERLWATALPSPACGGFISLNKDVGYQLLIACVDGEIVLKTIAEIVHGDALTVYNCHTTIMAFSATDDLKSFVVGGTGGKILLFFLHGSGVSLACEWAVSSVVSALRVLQFPSDHVEVFCGCHDGRVYRSSASLQLDRTPRHIRTTATHVHSEGYDGHHDDVRFIAPLRHVLQSSTVASADPIAHCQPHPWRSALPGENLPTNSSVESCSQTVPVPLTLLSGGDDGALKLWKISHSSSDTPGIFEGASLDRTLVASGDSLLWGDVWEQPGRMIAVTGGKDRSIRMWECNSRQPICTIDAFAVPKCAHVEHIIRATSVSSAESSETMIFVGGGDGRLRLWRVPSSAATESVGSKRRKTDQSGRQVPSSSFAGNVSCDTLVHKIPGGRGVAREEATGLIDSTGGRVHEQPISVISVVPMARPIQSPPGQAHQEIQEDTSPHGRSNEGESVHLQGSPRDGLVFLVLTADMGGDVVLSKCVV
eukprot:Rmarinus@m.16266